MFTQEKVLLLLERAGDNPAIGLVADWKKAVVHQLGSASQSMVVNAAASLATILETGGLTEEELT